MKKIGLAFALLVISFQALHAQDRRDELMDRIESRRVAFISDKLELSPQEAQVFWPIHNAYQDEMQALRTSSRFRDDFIKNDIDADTALLEMIAKEEKELALRKKYALRMKEVIGAKKTLMYYHLERKFKEEMLRELKNRRGEERGRRG